VVVVDDAASSKLKQVSPAEQPSGGCVLLKPAQTSPENVY
jgi:hypothetical protein